MRTLRQFLTEHELAVLRALGEWWELELTGDEKPACVEKLAKKLEQLDIEEEIGFLPADEASAIKALIRAGGKLPVPVFTRDYGKVRQMGPAALEREEPWFAPASSAEALWYRGFLFREFDDTGEGMGEFYCLPKELMPANVEPYIEEILPQTEDYEPASTPTKFKSANSTAVDDLTTLAIFAQNGGLHSDRLAEISPYLLDDNPKRLSLLLTLGLELSILRQEGDAYKPAKGAMGWLQQSREAQLRLLAEGWSGSSWNDLRHTSGLTFEGDGWQNEPILARTALLDALPQAINWYKIADVVATIKQLNPDFQRPDGNYDTWYIRLVESGEFVKGFEHWNEVEGRLLPFLLEGALHWLGMVDVADGVYRVQERMVDWLTDEGLPATEVAVPPTLQADGTLLVPLNANRFHRFQIGRIAESVPREARAGDTMPAVAYQYKITPRSLHQARAQGIMPARVLEFLAQVTERNLPAGINRAIERWGSAGTEGRLEQVTVLRVGDPKILDILRANPKSNPYLGESLGGSCCNCARYDTVAGTSGSIGAVVRMISLPVTVLAHFRSNRVLKMFGTVH